MEPSSGQRETSIAKTRATSSCPAKTRRNPHQKLGPAVISASPKMPYRATIGEMNANANANDDRSVNSRRRVVPLAADEAVVAWVMLASFGCAHYFPESTRVQRVGPHIRRKAQNRRLSWSNVQS